MEERVKKIQRKDNRKNSITKNDYLEIINIYIATINALVDFMRIEINRIKNSVQKIRDQYSDVIYRKDGLNHNFELKN